MRRLTPIIISLLCAFAWLASTQAQTPPRDYSLTASARLSDDNAELIFEIIVTNNGATASNETEVNVISLNQNGRVIASQTLRPLAAGETASITLIIGLDIFEPASVQAFRIEVGIDQFELAGSVIAQDNSASLSINIPNQIGGATRPESAQADPTDVIIPWLNIAINPNDPLQMGVLALIIAISAILLWIITVIARLLFQRKPEFANWQPSYATMAYHPPDSIAGRRQAWQQHAQNGSILAPPTPNAVHAVKRLVGMDGVKLSGWHITGIRISQYDMYGRVSRSEVIAPRALVRHLDRLAHKNTPTNRDKLRRPLRGIATQLLRPFYKKMNKRNAILPVALDMRFEGKHGEVRIIFELYQYQHGKWQPIDSWEPEMTVIGRNIQESYTYTINGKIGDETLKEYHKRLLEDVVWLLGELVYRPPTTTSATATTESLVPPDTLTNMQPIHMAEGKPDI